MDLWCSDNRGVVSISAVAVFDWGGLECEIFHLLVEGDYSRLRSDGWFHRS